jgi:branched-chain amino acid transport system permease protein
VSRARALAPARAVALWPVVPPALLVVVATLLASTGGAVIHDVMITGLIDLMFVVGLYCFAGTSGVFSFGHIGFAAIGAYAAGVLSISVETKKTLFTSMPSALVDLHTSPLLAVLAGGLVAAVIGGVVSIALMRLGGLAASLATFALLIIIHVVCQNLNQVTNGQSGLTDVPGSPSQWGLMVWCLIAIAVAFLFQESRWGLRLRASREDEVAAKATGIGVYNERRAAWTLSCFFAGVGGALYGQFLGTFNADAFYLDISFLIVAMLVIGGRNSLSGAVVGAVFVVVVQELLRRLEDGPHIGAIHIPSRPGLAATGLALIMLLVLILRPGGLTGGREVLWPFARSIRAPISGGPDVVAAAQSREREGSTPVPAPPGRESS